MFAISNGFPLNSVCGLAMLRQIAMADLQIVHAKRVYNASDSSDPQYKEWQCDMSPCQDKWNRELQAGIKPNVAKIRLVWSPSSSNWVCSTYD